jgi:predicted nuclease of predicted toxin-antitoxin system
MKILLDECVPGPLRRHFTGHECDIVSQSGLTGKKNGELPRMAEERGYAVLLTVDKSMPSQQRIQGRRIAVLIMRASSNDLADLLPLVPECLAVLGDIKPGQVIRVPISA